MKPTPVEVRETEIPGVLEIHPRVFRDARGSFMETYKRGAYVAAGIDLEFVQDNLSSSARGVLRGLHFQEPCPQAKLVGVLAGRAFDVAVDIRAGSPTFGRWVGRELSAENAMQLLIPEGFAHGFQALEEGTLFAYKCSAPYSPGTERGVRWDDPELGIPWPLPDPVVNDKDRAAPFLADLPEEHQPTYTP